MGRFNALYLFVKTGKWVWCVSVTIALLSTCSVAVATVAFYSKGRNKTARTLEYFELNKRLLQMIRNSLCKLKIWSALINADFTCYCRSWFLSCKEEKTLQTRLVRSCINWCPVSSWWNVIWRAQDRRTKQHWKTYLRSCQLFLVCCCFSAFSTIFSMHHAFASSSYCGLHWRCGWGECIDSRRKSDFNPGRMCWNL